MTYLIFYGLFHLSVFVFPLKHGRDSFLLSMGVFFNRSKFPFKPFLREMLFGFSFLFRFQIAFAIAAFRVWLILMDKKKWNYLIKEGVSFFLVLLAGISIDTWFYREFVFTKVYFLSQRREK